MLIGNKCDLNERRKIEKSQADYTARSWKVNYIETSAKTRENVDKAFFDLLRLIRESKINFNTGSSNNGGSNSNNGTNNKGDSTSSSAASSTKKNGEKSKIKKQEQENEENDKKVCLCF